MKLRNVRRPDWLRFGVFLALVAGMTMYVAARWDEFRLSETERTAAVPAAGDSALHEAVPALPPPAFIPPVPAPGPTAGAPAGDFFAEYRLERDRARGQEREMLREVMAGAAATDEARRQANLRYLGLSTAMGLETQLEGLIRGRGFVDAVVFLGDGTAQVVVKATALTGPDAARIGDLVRQVAGVKPTAITVVHRDR